jgi:hypothetical protein
MFARKQPAERMARALEQVRRMGYEFHAPEVRIGTPMNGTVTVRLTIENRGVAPFYFDWTPQYGLLQAGQAVTTAAGSGKLTGLLPGDKPRVWTDTIDVTGLKPGTYILAVRVPNPLKTGKPLRFANATQDRDAPGWLSLGEVVIP